MQLHDSKENNAGAKWYCVRLEILFNLVERHKQNRPNLQREQGWHIIQQINKT